MIRGAVLTGYTGWPNAASGGGAGAAGAVGEGGPEQITCSLYKSTAPPAVCARLINHPQVNL